LRKLEARFADVLTVVGIHAGKYPNERVTAQIRLAAARLGVEHPIANDRQFRCWRRYQVQAWPTLVFLGPDGEYLGTHAGEASFDALASALGDLVAAADSRGALRRRIPGRATGSGPAEGGAPDTGPLRFPTKVAAAGADRLFVADTGHDRVLDLAVDTDAATGEVGTAIGSGEPGFADGAFGEARFRHPHGLAFDGATLYVADTGNHAVRAVDLETRTVRTVAGTGERGDLVPWEPLAGRDAALASPWDLALDGRTLHVAMAGLHQLWALELGEERVRAFAGSSHEALADGILRGAALAQPSALVATGDRLYFADAESSSVRWADLRTSFGERAVHTVVGTGLFDFGDVDGAGDDARLQHASGLAAWGEGLLVADTYNHKLKFVEPEARRSSAWTDGAECGGFNEPEGLALLAGRVVVADTNHHRLVIVTPWDGGGPRCRPLALSGG